MDFERPALQGEGAGESIFSSLGLPEPDAAQPSAIAPAPVTPAPIVAPVAAPAPAAAEPGPTPITNETLKPAPITRPPVAAEAPVAPEKVAAPVSAPKKDIFKELGLPAPDSSVGVTDFAKSAAAGAASGVGMIAQGGGELLARGINKVGETLGFDPKVRAVNPLQGWINDLMDSRTPAAKKAEAESQISGELLKPETWKFGDNPSISGIALQGMNAIGQFAPNLAIALVTAGASVPVQLTTGALVGGIQALGGALDEEREAVAKMSHEDLMAGSKLYAQLIAHGVPRGQAKEAVGEAAAIGGGLGNAIPSAAEGAFENFLIGALTRGKLNVPALFGAGKTGRIATGVLGGAATGGAEEAIEQAGQNIGSNAAIGGNRPVGEGTLQQFIMGALAEGAAGGGAGVISKGPVATAASAAPVAPAGTATPPGGGAPPPGGAGGPAEPPGGTPGNRNYPLVDSEGLSYRQFESGNVVDGNEHFKQGQSDRVYPNEPQTPKGPMAQAADIATTTGLSPRHAEPFFPFTAQGAQRRAGFLNRQGQASRVTPHPEHEGRFAIIPDEYGAAKDDKAKIKALENEGNALIERLPKGRLMPAVQTRIREIDAEIEKLKSDAAARTEKADKEKADQAKKKEADEKIAKAAADAEKKKAGEVAAMDAQRRREEDTARNREQSDVVTAHLTTARVAGMEGNDEPNAMQLALQRALKKNGVATVPTVDEAAHAAATSPQNERSEPTPAQINAGNYKMGPVKVGPFNISVENSAESIRRSKPGAAKPWERKMIDHYGYYKGVVARAKDKDRVDAFLKKGTPVDHRGPVYIIDQNHDNGQFDEPKAMNGYASRDEAVKAYLAHYQPGWASHIRGVTEVSTDEMQRRLDTTDAFMKPQPDAQPLEGKTVTAYPSKSAAQKLARELEQNFKTAQKVVPHPTEAGKFAVVDEIADERLKDAELRTELAGMAKEAGWAQEGGKMLRNAGTGEISRTTWIPHAAWWPGRPSKMGATETREAVRKALAGERLSIPEKRQVQYMLDNAQRTLDGGDLTSSDVETSGYNDLTEAERAEIDELIAHAESVLGADKVEALRERVAIATEGKGEMAYADALKESIDEDINKDGAGEQETGNQAEEHAGGEASAAGGRSEQNSSSRLDQESQGDEVIPQVPAVEPTTPAKAGVSASAADKVDKAAAEVSKEPANPMGAVASALRTAADAIDEAVAPTKESATPASGLSTASSKEGAKTPAAADSIDDFGEKIGGARKDTAQPTGNRVQEAAEESAEPGWRKRFTVAQIAASRNANEVGQWVVHDERKKDFRGQARQVGNPFPTKEAAEQAIPLMAVAQKHHVVPGATTDGVTPYTIWRYVTDRKRVQVVKEQFTTRDDAMRYMAQHAVDIIETKTAYGEEILARPDKVMRKGTERRSASATPPMFMDTFGFRGVEFGKWNNQDERQEVMNHAYDGLLDLAEVLKVPPKALSLNGELALAFGARGQGLSSARAHYERDYGVINLTKMAGAGTLAHEWFHATDHYFARQDTKAKSEKIKNERGDLVYPASTPRLDYASHGFRSANSQVRPELRAAYTDLIQTMFTKAEQYVEDTQKAEKFVGSARERLAEALNGIREALLRGPEQLHYMKRNNKPASAEQMATFEQLADKLVSGEDLVTQYRPSQESAGKKIGAPGWMAGRQTNDTLEGISAILKVVRGRNGFTSKGDGTLDGFRYLMKVYAERIAMLKSANASESKTKRVPTSYAMESKRIDQGRASDYWTTEHEMAARAFSAYVEDKIAEQGNRSDFLAYGSDNNLPQYRMFNVRPFPEGKERVAINEGFDKLFGELQTRETEHGTVMFGPIGRYLLPNGDYNINHGQASENGVQAPRRKNPDAGSTSPERDLFTDAGVSSPPEGPQPPLVVGLANRGTMHIGFDRLNTPEKAAHAFASLRKSPYEKFQIIVTDAADKPLAAWHMFSGTLAQTAVYPREVLTAAYMTPGAAKMWMAHNHPSNIAEPSSADENLTLAIAQGLGKDIGVELSGHIIIANNKARYFDNVNNREMREFAIPPASRKFSIPILDRTIKRQSAAARPSLNSPSAVRDYIKKIDPKESGLFLMDPQNRVMGWWPISVTEMGKLRTGDVNSGAGRVMQMVGTLNPGAAIAYTPGQFDDKRFTSAVQNLGTLLQNTLDVRLLDAFGKDEAGELTSFAESQIDTTGEVFFSRALDRVQARNGETVFHNDEVAFGLPTRHGKSVDYVIFDKKTVAEAQSQKRKLTAAGDGLGHLRLGVTPEGDIASLKSIYFDKSIRKNGWGEKVLRGILATIPANRDLFIENILPEAHDFWAKMGTRFEPGRFHDDGFLSRGAYERARGRISDEAGTGGLVFRRGEGDVAQVHSGAGAAGVGRPDANGQGPVTSDTANQAPPSAGLSVSEVQKVVDQLVGEAGKKIHVAETVDQLPKVAIDKLKSEGATGVRGVFLPKTDEIWVVASNVHSAAEVAVVAIHEGAHRGLRAFFGNQITPVLNQIWLTNPKVRRKTAEYQNRFKIERDEAIEEVLADMATHGNASQLRHWDKLVAFIKKWIAAFGETLRINLRFTDDMVQTLVGAASTIGLRDNVNEFDDKIAAHYQVSDALLSRAGSLEAARANMATTSPLAAARGLMDEITHSDRVLNRVISKFNTPFHIAETHPEFKPVYDETQSFLHDVSRVASESADLAPDLLPRIEKFSDFKKNAPSNDDVAAASAAVHAGTLYAGGNPLNGVRWSDDELRGKATIERPFPPGMPKLTEKQIGLYHQHLESVTHSLEEHSKSLIWRIARQTGIDLDRGHGLEVMAQAARDAADERINGIRLRVAAMDESNTAKSAEFAKLNEQLTELNGFKTSITDIEDKTAGLIEHGYSPLMRFGQYAVNVASVDDNGHWHEEWFGRFDTQMAANAARAEIERDPQYKGMQITSGVMNPELHKLFQGLNLDALQLFAEHMKDDNGNPISLDPVMQQAFRIATAERSVMKRQIHRKGTPGYSKDLPRILSQFTTSTARSTSTNYHGAAMLKAAQAIKAGDLQGYATRYVRYVNDPAEESQALRGFLANYYILGSLAFGAVNMTQPLFVTAPYLSAQTSWANALKELGKASIDYARGMVGLPADEQAAYNRARNEGVVSPQEIHQLRAEGQATMFGNSRLWEKLSSTAAAAGIPMPGRLLMRKLSFIWGSIYSITEQYNRAATFLAAYRIAKGNGEANPYAAAVKAVEATQFTYNRGNRMEASRGPIGSVVMTFKSFNVSYLELAKRLYKQDKKAFAVMMLTLMALAGTEGLPFAEDIEDLIDTIGQWMGYATNTKKLLRKHATNILGRDIADVMLHGTSAIPGVPIDVSQRMGMHNIVPGSAMLKSSEPDKTRDVLELLGPAATLWKNSMTAVEAIATGKPEGAKVLLPSALQNVAKGVDMVETGTYRDSKGKKVMDVTTADAFFKMIGFQPAKVAAENRVISQNMQDISMQKVTEDSIASMMAQGYFEKRPDLVKEAQDNLRQWNDNNPELRVRITPAQVQSRVKQMMMTREQRFIKSAPPEIRGAISQEFKGAR